MRKKKKAILLALIAIAGFASCSISNNNKNDDLEELSIVEVYTPRDSFIDDSIEKPVTDQEEVWIPPVVESKEKKDTDPFIDVYDYAYLKVDSPLYDEYMQISNIIEEYQKVYVTSANSKYAKVITSENESGYMEIDNIEYLPKDYIELDLSDQIVKVYNDGELVFSADVVTGKPSTPTNIGYTEISSKTYNRYLVGKDYKVWVDYFFVFNDCAEGYHDASWQSSFGGDRYIQHGSHGCCNMDHDDVRQMDQYIEVGTKNLVHN